MLTDNETTMTVSRTCELAYRSGDGIEVSLLWSRRTNRLTVLVRDVHTGEFFHFSPPPDRGLDAFYHPFAYAPEDAELSALASRGAVFA